MSVISPNFLTYRWHPKASLYPCEYCVQFPIFKAKDLAADSFRETKSVGAPGPLADFNVDIKIIAT